MIRFDRMGLEDPTMLVIDMCWAVFTVTWVVSALFVKRTVERSNTWIIIFSVLLFFVARVVLRARGGFAWFASATLWSRTPLVGAVANAIAIAGLVIAIWARLVIGRNWSGVVVLKENHELIERGPYAHVRHPIYSGLLLLGLGTAIAYGRPSGFVVLAIGFAWLAVKAHFEERLLTRHFPEAYPDYRRRVKALIPHVL